MEDFLIWFWDEWNQFKDLGGNTFRNVSLFIAAIGGFSFAFWRSRISTKQNEISERSLNMDRYQRGAAMLGNENSFVVEAGIRMLGVLARQHMNEYFPLVNRLLYSYIKSTSPTPENKISASAEQEIYHVTPAVCTSALLELSTLNNVRHKRNIFAQENIQLGETSLDKINLTGADFRKAGFPYSDLRSVRLFKCDLRMTNFYGSDFSNAYLEKSDFRGAFLVSCNFTNARLGEVNFAGVELTASNRLTYTQLSQAKNVDPEFLEELRLKELSEKETSNPEAAPPTIP